MNMGGSWLSKIDPFLKIMPEEDSSFYSSLNRVRADIPKFVLGTHIYVSCENVRTQLLDGCRSLPTEQFSSNT